MRFKFEKGSKPKTVVKVGGVKIGDGFTVIAGPCAVESQEQIMKVAEFLAEMGVKCSAEKGLSNRGRVHTPSRGTGKRP